MGKYKVIGIMSGTSLDGLDIACCEFKKLKTWRYKIKYAVTIKYNKEWRKKLRSAIMMKKPELQALDLEYGRFIGAEIRKLIRHKNISADLIASHGHTVFHQPEKKLTLQIGNGCEIASFTALPVVCDFRSGDVALGGQGAPLVPLADKMLFSEYAFCLNLGGFANISFDKNKQRIAFDICPANIVLNELAGKLGKEFDEGGKLASKGIIHEKLLKNLNTLPFYKNKPPKSLGREWVENKFLPALGSFDISIQDKLRTVVEHIALQISSVLNSEPRTPHPELLFTGGGAYNKFLIGRISHHAKCKIVLPDDKTIQFKEAMAFAFLGLLKMRGEINILKSVTGAKRDSSGGVICFQDQNEESSS
ncbi:MAG: anhydro-N-acetylmuramic acid kinase [Bacteroidetes bacterium]|nr:MAG: anhydro-N-acetylmuramic acid kinase [Bacteroidota bacterium]